MLTRPYGRLLSFNLETKALEICSCEEFPGTDPALSNLGVDGDDQLNCIMFHHKQTLYRLISDIKNQKGLLHRWDPTNREYQNLSKNAADWGIMSTWNSAACSVVPSQELLLSVIVENNKESDETRIVITRLHFPTGSTDVVHLTGNDVENEELNGLVELYSSGYALLRTPLVLTSDENHIVTAGNFTNEPKRRFLIINISDPYHE